MFNARGGSWAPQPPVCWYCNRHVGTKHADTCVFDGKVPPPAKKDDA